MFLNGYPYTDFHELNLDFLLQSMEVLKKAFKDFTGANSLVFAEPLLHDITKQYAKNTIVIDENGDAFISLQIVPAGISLSNSDYWLEVFDFEGYVSRANKNLTDNYFSNVDRTPIALSVGDWLVLDDVLYKVTVAIPIDGLFEVGVNIEHFTVEQFLKDFVTAINQTVLQYKNDIDASEAAFTSYLQEQFNQVLAGVTVDSEVINARVGFNGVTYPTLGTGITSQANLIIDDLVRKIDHVKNDVAGVISSSYKIPSTRSDGSISGNKGDTITIGSEAYWKHDEISVKAGDVFTAHIKTTANLSSCYVLFCNGSTVLYDKSFYNSNVEWINIEIVVPEDCDTLYIACYIENASDVNNFVIDKKLFDSSITMLGQLYEVLDKMPELISYTDYPGQRFDGVSKNLISSTSATATVINVDAGYTYRLHMQGVGSSASIPLMFYDSNDDLIGYLDNVTYSGNQLDVFIPDKCTRIRFSRYVSSTWNWVEKLLVSISPYTAGVSAYNNEIAANTWLATGKAYDISYLYTNENKYPNVAHDLITSYGTASYWNMITVTPEFGLFADIHTAANINSAPYVLYVNDDDIIIDSDILATASETDYSKVPLRIIEGCTKIYVRSYLTAPKIKKVYADKYGLPGYYTDSWKDTLRAKILDKTGIQYGVSFIFATDFHFGDNMLNSKGLMQYFLDHSQIPFAIFGGDYPVAYGSEDDVKESIDILNDYVNEIGRENVFVMKGNHDFSIKTNTDPNDTSGYTLPAPETFANLFANDQYRSTKYDSASGCFMIDFPSIKLRVVCANTNEGQTSNTAERWGVGYGVSAAQVDWIVNNVLNVSNYSIIMISHITLSPNMPSYNSGVKGLEDMVVAVNNNTIMNSTWSYAPNGGYNPSVSQSYSHDFTNDTNKIICCISGHSHEDASLTENNTLYIETTCDACYPDDGEGAVKGTITEQAFDVYCIDLYNQTIDTVRIGRGSDRTFTY